MKGLAVPSRLYPLSYFSVSSGRGGRGARTSLINYLLASFIKTKGCSGSQGR